MKNNRFNLKKQTPPFSIQIELTEGCNLGCSFCGLRGMRKKGTIPYFFLDIETAKRIADEIKRVGWKSRIIFSMHGEPTLNKNIFKILKIFRKRLPNNQFHMISNGYGIVNDDNLSITEYVEKLKKSGLNDLLIDMYANGDGMKVADEIIKTDIDVEILEKGISFYSNRKKFRVLLIPDLTKDKDNKGTRKLANHAGAAFPRDFSYNNKKCAMPFRELAIRYDGNVSICCDDFRGEYPIADLKTTDIEDIWNHERFQAARIMLYNGDRNFMPCSGCTNISPRVGLLPDPKGQETLPPITVEVRKLAQSVYKNNKPLSKIIVKRKWEK